jgi:hypothetical protein
MLVDGGADVNMQRQSDGYTPLHIATYKGSTCMVRQLLKLGADPSIRDQSGKTSLDTFTDLQDERDLPYEVGSLLSAKPDQPEGIRGNITGESSCEKFNSPPAGPRRSECLRGKDHADDKAGARPAKKARVSKR